MLNRLFGGGSVPTLEALMRFATVRQRAIAGNIANVDTPGYRTLDLEDRDFQRLLTRASAGAPWSGSLEPQAAGDAGSLKANGNNVDLEVEMAKMVRNSTLHATAASLLAQQFLLLREAIGGRVIG